MQINQNLCKFFVFFKCPQMLAVWYTGVRCSTVLVHKWQYWHVLYSFIGNMIWLLFYIKNKNENKFHTVDLKWCHLSAPDLAPAVQLYTTSKSHRQLTKSLFKDVRGLRNHRKNAEIFMSLGDFFSFFRNVFDHLWHESSIVLQDVIVIIVIIIIIIIIIINNNSSSSGRAFAAKIQGWWRGVGCLQYLFKHL